MPIGARPHRPPELELAVGANYPGHGALSDAFAGTF